MGRRTRGLCFHFLIPIYYLSNNFLQVFDELASIANDYESIVTSLDRGSTLDPYVDEGLQERVMTISSGHSQVSIVACYRNSQWMRIPVLLLAEGDIIALMAGGEQIREWTIYCILNNVVKTEN